MEKIKISFEDVLKAKGVNNQIDYYSLYLQRKINLEKEDARQEILLHLFQVYEKYDFLISGINTFFITIIKRYAIKLIREYFREKRTILRNSFSLQHYVNEDGNIVERQLISVINLEENVINMQIIENVSKKLKGTSLFIFESLLWGEKITLIAEQLLMTKQGVRKNIKQKILPLLSSEYCLI